MEIRRYILSGKEVTHSASMIEIVRSNQREVEQSTNMMELQKPLSGTARVMNALNSHGARGNVYKLLEKYGARYSEAESKQVVYDGNDLTVKAYFKDERAAMEFQTALNGWEIHRALVNLDGIKISPRDPLPVPQPPDLTRSLLATVLINWNHTDSAIPSPSL
eukprot:scaffold1640_cov161-Amphora_coffeaeformis.AAC.32